ncbi:CPCC family cysteine-rich protein [Chryseobacterium gambrini]|uniref:CPCC family cysteine-rich protein n=1 Tax=Chryseobacterium gambrini TaxID=373672 RepID=UPI0022F3A770|nr:CPCC family cysteine-rich protein [Chryseobacterium gambrini]WBX99535.1 CPCC family cysteine-rich protein [Chryseobacterium gambrini]
MKDIFEFKASVDNDAYRFTEEIVDSFIAFIESKSVFWGGGYSENYIQGSICCDEKLYIDEEDLQNEIVAYFQKLNDNIEVEISIFGVPKIRFDYLQCFCCGYFTIEERGNYQICPVCFWEDDGGRELTKISSPNHMILKEGRENFSRFGACDERFVKYAIKNPEDKFKKGDL